MPELRPAEARAPGKLILLGEYAVLYGAPAVVAAINRYAVARLQPRRSGGCRLHAAELSRDPIEFKLTERGVDWRNGIEPELGLVDAVLSTAVRERLLASQSQFDLFLSTAELYTGADKLGLGSSAAIAVALSRALLEAADQGADAVGALAHLAHRRFQQGKGSGGDVAASISGGVIQFRQVDGAPRAVQLSLPPELQWRCYWTGRSASTRHFLAGIERLAAANPALHKQHFSALKDLAEDGVEALRRRQCERFVKLVNDYRGALAALGTAAELDIVDAGHRQLAALASACGAGYKPSGAGGGDLGIAFGSDFAMAELQRRAAAAGFTPIDVTVADVSSLRPAPKTG